MDEVRGEVYEDGNGILIRTGEAEPEAKAEGGVLAIDDEC
jgi:hypothetical protein